MGLGQTELKDILEKHRKWARGEDGGQRAYLRGAYLQGAYLQGAYLQGADLRGADLQGAYLRGADLRGADLQGAYLRGADLRGADLRGADLRGADLRGADLQGADLRGAELDDIKSDFFEVLKAAEAEVAGLYDALMRGKIDGSTYSGECACLVGTIANVRRVDVNTLEKNSDRPAEVWFLAIQKGDTPQSNVISDITREWVEEFAKERHIGLPKYKLVSNEEFPGAF